MAKPKKETEATAEKKNVAPEKKAEPTKKTAEPKTAAKEEPKKDPGPAVSFVRWFKSKGFKPHWRRGMEAYADTAGRHTVEEWNKLFKAY